ncbi:MAG TPA: division/cell wall cluster transcriptional repressor MraZ [Acetobacteraceae bacterium]|jgi:MraZ protein|nr:division/cell wall cluster transcriptional repressor MraZ [Acetobacteraceae bacterium]
MQFLGSHQNRLDAKGRVSVPASFRTTLRQAPDGNGNGATHGAGGQLILRPSHFYACIEAWPPARFAALEAPLAQYSLLSPEHQDLATSLYADAFPVDVDKEGRILIPEQLVAHAGLTEAVLFMGVGPTFQIWEPAAAERRRAEARIRSRELAPHGGVAHAGPHAGVSA